MLGLFKKKKYIHRTDGHLWTKNLVLGKIANELSALNPALNGNTMSFRDCPELTIDFIASNYSEKDELNLNGSIMVKNGDELSFLLDLFSQCKTAYGKKYRGLHIFKDEEWEGSQLQKECREVFLPLIRDLFDPAKRQELKET